MTITHRLRALASLALVLASMVSIVVNFIFAKTRDAFGFPIDTWTDTVFVMSWIAMTAGIGLYWYRRQNIFMFVLSLAVTAFIGYLVVALVAIASWVGLFAWATSR